MRHFWPILSIGIAALPGCWKTGGQESPDSEKVYERDTRGNLDSATVLDVDTSASSDSDDTEDTGIVIDDIGEDKTCNTEVVWRIPQPEGLIYVNLTPVTGTDALLAQIFTTVYRLDGERGATVLYEYVDGDHLTAYFSDSGDAFTVMVPESGPDDLPRIPLYDATGARVTSFLYNPTAEFLYGQSFTPVPSQPLVYVEEWLNDLEGSILAGIEVRNYEDEVLATFRGDSDELWQYDLWAFSGNGEHLFYILQTGLARLSTVDFQMTWSVPTSGTRDLASSFDGNTVLVQQRNQAYMIRHGAPLADPIDIPDVTWDLAISSSGEWGAVTTSKSVHLMRDGVEAFSLAVPFEYVVTLDVSDDGQVLIGGQDESSMGYAWLLDRDGRLLFQKTSAPDNSAWRPRVRFVDGTDRFFVKDRDYVTMYRIVGVDPDCQTVE